MKTIIGNKYTKWFCISLLILWMGVIFWLSCENADDSTKTSGVLVDVLAKLFGIDTQTAEFLEFTNFIRKCAHFIEFAVLGGLAFLCVSHFKTGMLQRFYFSLVFAFLYAVSDEFHQYFVPGRACRFTDVCIDSLGSVLGTLFAFSVICIYYKIKEKKQ